jgi:hypothetical protein
MNFVSYEPIVANGADCDLSGLVRQTFLMAESDEKRPPQKVAEQWICAPIMDRREISLSAS